jgi:DNA-binding NtrC family response regulator
LEKRLSCLSLHLLPLRERSDDIPSITALYLHKLNVSLGKQIIGLEAEAMELFTAFPWTHNLDQLQHVLKELAVVTKTPYITYNDVKYFLDQETPTMPSLPSVDLDLSQTLDEINYQIILTVLAEEHENKEKTASRLGISRSTLWRILKTHNGI